MSAPRARVLFAFEWLPDYVVEMFRELRARLGEDGIALDLTHGDPPSRFASRGTSTSLEWATRVPNRAVNVGSRTIFWQPITDRARAADLVIVEQASRALLTYWLLAEQRRGRARMAFWGHGVNPNRNQALRASERVKRWFSRHPHWWFAHTESVRRHLLDLGYPNDRITVVQNAGDSVTLRRELSDLSAERARAIRAELGVDGAVIGLFLGSLYREKRLRYLLDAADRVHALMPEFRLVVGGDGPDRAEVMAATAGRPHVVYAGRVDGERKAALLDCAGALLLPGAVGLGIVDGLVAGVPTVTTAVPTHGPEIDYLRDRANGRMLGAETSPELYAEAVVTILRDGAELRAGAAADGRIYTTETMVERFDRGIRSALAAPGRCG